jgi:PPOX class probable F420-dependent enzyme
MAIPQGDLALLDEPLAQELLRSTIPARLAYVGRDGSPRAVPIAFTWDGEEVVFATWPDAAKVAALRERPAVALTIDSEHPPYKVLQVRGAARVEVVDGVPEEYAAACERYLGPEAGPAWAAQVGAMFPRMARIAVRPAWAGLLDFEARFPKGIADAMGTG